MRETLLKYGDLMSMLSDGQLGMVMHAVIDYNCLVVERDPDELQQTIRGSLNGDKACEIIFQMLITEAL